MNEREFYKAVEENILQFMPEGYETAKARVDEVTKPGDIRLHGLSVNKGGMASCPILYVDDYYKHIQNGWPMEKVLVIMAAQYDDLLRQYPGLEAPDLDYDKIKDDLRVRLIYEKDNQELLKDYYSIDVGCGYVLTIYIDLSKKFAEGAVTNIRKDMISRFGYDEDMLVRDAVAASIANAPARLTHIEAEIFGNMYGYGSENLLDKEDLDHAEEGILVLTTADKHWGAAALYYPGVKDRIGEIVQGSYFILPSSIHEVLICPDDGLHNAKDLAEMVSMINMAEVAKEEQLGNRVLYYDALTRSIDVAMDKDREISDELELG